MGSQSEVTVSKSVSPEMVKLFRGASHRTSGSHCSHSPTAWTFTGSIYLLESGMESHSVVSIFLIRKDSYWFVSISSYVVSLLLFNICDLFIQQTNMYTVWDIHAAL